ncbi:hypothetical protein BST11_06500 [Mycobacterium alsense]|nr:hypothetical protein BST11_06500 [Mycobacterium alsense]
MKLDLAAPIGATWVDRWESTGTTFRVFDGQEWKIKPVADHGGRDPIGDIVVSIIGRQYADGHAEREIIIEGADASVITPTEARKLGSALIAAAEAADG